MFASLLARLAAVSPARRGRSGRSPFAIVLTGIGVALVCGAGLVTATLAQGDTAANPAKTFPPCFGAAAHDYLHPCSNSSLRLKSEPTPDEAVIEPNSECLTFALRSKPYVCTFGFQPPEAAKAAESIALVGDSHAAHWRAALGPVAVNREWAGYSLTRSSCPFSTTTPVLDEATKRACVRWNPQVQAWFKRHKDVSTVFTSEHIQVSVEDSKHRGQFEAKVRGYMNQWRALPPTVKHIVVIKDTPRATGNTAGCVADALDAKKRPGTACAIKRSFAVKKDPAVEAVRRLHSSRYLAIDMTNFFCSARFCLPVIGGALVFKDPGHITRVYGETLAPYLERAINALAPFKPVAEPAPTPAG